MAGRYRARHSNPRTACFVLRAAATDKYSSRERVLRPTQQLIFDAGFYSCMGALLRPQCMIIPRKSKAYSFGEASNKIRNASRSTCARTEAVYIIVAQGTPQPTLCSRTKNTMRPNHGSERQEKNTQQTLAVSARTRLEGTRQFNQNKTLRGAGDAVDAM